MMSTGIRSCRKSRRKKAEREQAELWSKSELKFLDMIRYDAYEI